MRASVKTWFVTLGVTAVLLFFFAAPLAAIIYGGAAAGISGAILLAPLVVVQGLVFLLFRRHFPKVSLGKPDEKPE